MRVPDGIRRDLRSKVSVLADGVGWQGLAAADRSRLYQSWTDDPAIGGVLSRFLSTNQIRTYIKDTLMKPYARAKLSQLERVLALAGEESEVEPVQTFARPHGVLLRGPKLICWGRAEDWKQVLMALFERTFGAKTSPRSTLVLLNATGRWEQDGFRSLVQSAATRLGINKVLWST